MLFITSKIDYNIGQEVYCNMGLLQLFEYRAFISVSVDFIIVSGTYYISVESA